ncbi:MAG TPA: metalloregulator ArsR/SmtB family transcription factor [Sphingomonas sp.]|nr:metalloregulator ArsR/SmtB family transcription factor [Sphingomonas sp.]
MEDALSRQLTAIADPTRRAILARLTQGEATVAELQKPFGISQPAISRHLKVLEAAGLIEASQSAQSRPRRLKPGALRETADWIDHFRNLWSDSFDRLGAFLRSEGANPGEE